MASLLKKYSCL